MASQAFRSMRPRELLRILESLGYRTVAQKGSHRKLEAPGRPRVILAFHPSVTIGPTVVRDILVKQAGLSLAEAEEVVRRG